MRDPEPREIRYFAEAAELGAWFEAHHERAELLWVGYFKTATGRASITWPESVDEALCVGWIDGIRKRIDEERYCIRFTPRRSTSIWSRVNLDRYAELAAQDRIRPAGRRAYEDRDVAKSGLYSYERAEASLTAAQERAIREVSEAWAYFEALPPGHRRQVIHWVTSAKREDTRQRRLRKLIEACAEGRRLF